LAQDADINAGGTPPGRLRGVIPMPTQDIIDVKLHLFVELLSRGLDMLLMLSAMIRVPPTQNVMV
jgi:hypothetical protein